MVVGGGDGVLWIGLGVLVGIHGRTYPQPLPFMEGSRYWDRQRLAARFGFHLFVHAFHFFGLTGKGIEFLKIEDGVGVEDCLLVLVALFLHESIEGGDGGNEWVTGSTLFAGEEFREVFLVGNERRLEPLVHDGEEPLWRMLLEFGDEELCFFRYEFFGTESIYGVALRASFFV